jgi:hypothetical protein
MFFDDHKMEGESVINIKMHLELWIFNAKAIHQLKICKMLIQFNHNHISCSRTLGFHLPNGCQKKIFEDGLISTSNCIGNMNLIIMTIH